jgi:hypothetical protein
MHSVEMLSTGLRSMVSQILILIDALFFAFWEIKRKRKREKWPEFFSPRSGHALLALLCGIFVAVRCN